MDAVAIVDAAVRYIAGCACIALFRDLALKKSVLGSRGHVGLLIFKFLCADQFCSCALFREFDSDLPLLKADSQL